MLLSIYEKIPPKFVTYLSHTKNSISYFTKKPFKEAIGSDTSYIEGDNLTFLQKKALISFLLLKRLFYRFTPRKISVKKATMK